MIKFGTSSIWIHDRVWWESLLIPADGPAQAHFRVLYSRRREIELLTDKKSSPRSALDWATRRVRQAFPGYRPLVHASLVRS